MALHLYITGRVQGVGFRVHLQRQAIALNLNGWVKNCPDGSVEALVSRSPGAEAAILAWAQKGPSGARVDRCDSYTVNTPKLKEFVIATSD